MYSLVGKTSLVLHEEHHVMLVEKMASYSFVIADIVPNVQNVLVHLITNWYHLKIDFNHRFFKRISTTR